MYDSLPFIRRPFWWTLAFFWWTLDFLVNIRLFGEHYFPQWGTYTHASSYRWPRTRRALTLFNGIPLRTRRALFLYTLYSDRILLVLNSLMEVLWTALMPFWLSTDNVICFTILVMGTIHSLRGVPGLYVRCQSCMSYEVPQMNPFTNTQKKVQGID